MLGKDHLDSWFFLATFSCVAHSKHSVKIMYSKLTAWSVCIYIYLYNNDVTSVCIFIGCWPWSIKGHTRRWREIHVSRLLFLFSCPKNPSINHLNFYCIKQRLHFSVCVYCNRSQKTSQRACKEQQSHHSTSSRVVLFCSLHAWRHLWSITVHTQRKM